MPRRARSAMIVCFVTQCALCSLAACEREARDIGKPAPSRADSAQVVTQGALQLGKHDVLKINVRTAQSGTPTDSADPYSDNAYGTSEGKRLYSWMNCSGCHAQGGGAIGPALMDATWLYGGSPTDIYNTIEHGRPNGMPAFATRLNSKQIWQLVAYVRSQGGVTPKWSRPGRDDHMQVKLPEQQTPNANSLRK